MPNRISGDRLSNARLPARFEGRQVFGGCLLLMGAALFFGLIPVVLFFHTKGAWYAILGLLTPGGAYMLWDGTMRLARVTLVLGAESIRYTHFGRTREMPWSRVRRVELSIEADDESRILVSIRDDAGMRFKIWQGAFSPDQLHAIIQILESGVARHPNAKIEGCVGL